MFYDVDVFLPLLLMFFLFLLFIKITNIVDSLEEKKNSLCVAVMIFNIYLQVNNEYCDSGIDYTCANRKSK